MKINGLNIVLPLSVAVAICLTAGPLLRAEEKAPTKSVPTSPIRPLPPAKPLDPPKSPDPAPPTEPGKPHAPRHTPQDKIQTRVTSVLGSMPDQATQAALARKVSLDFANAPLADVTDAIRAQTKLDIDLLFKDPTRESAKAEDKPEDKKPVEKKPDQPAPPTSKSTDTKHPGPQPAAPNSPAVNPTPIISTPAKPAEVKTTTAKPAETKDGQPLVTVHLKDVSATSALNLIAHDIGWTWYAEQGQVLLTEEPTLPLVPQVYNVRDLVLAQPGAEPSADDNGDYQYDPLGDIITGTLDFPLSGENATAGTQDCSPFHGTFTIAQDQQLQTRVANLLGALRRAKNLKNYDATVSAGIPISTTDQTAIDKALEKPVDAKIVAANIDELADWLRNFTGAPVHVDAHARAAGFTSQLAEPLELPGTPLHQVLDVLLSDTPLSYVVRDEALVITTKNDAGESRSVRVYPIGDLIVGDADRDGIDEEYARLLDVVTRTVEPDSWATLDKAKSGNAYVGYLPTARAFVCDQTRGAHGQIADVLAKLRKAVGEQPITTAKTPATPELDKDKKRPLSMKIYKLNTDLPGDDFVSVVHDLIEPKLWSGEAYIHAVPGAIVVKQTPAMQRRVEKLLVQLGAIPDPKKAAVSGLPTLVGRRRAI